MIGYRLRQYSKLLSLFLSFVLLVYFLEVHVDAPPVIIGSLVGAMPLALFEATKQLEKPSVEITDVDLVKYPRRYFDVKKSLGMKSHNSVFLRVNIKNVGFETAEECLCRVEFDSISGSFSTRWNQSDYPMTITLPPGAEREVDVLSVDLPQKDLWTADAGEESDNHYPKSRRPEIRNGELGVQLSVSARNMSEKFFDLSERQGGFEFPSDFLEQCRDADVITSLREVGEYGLEYYVEGETVLRKPRDMDLNKLAEVNLVRRKIGNSRTDIESYYNSILEED